MRGSLKTVRARVGRIAGAVTRQFGEMSDAEFIARLQSARHLTLVERPVETGGGRGAGAG